ncbi:MAG: phosphate ABC transporter substrate-binding protein PstS [Candidatus Bathyarchaeota archaeon]|nr:phosphate ABC transporter substrate-binding protein PstS [Candidatus Bathyarchaeota archaeon]
MNTKYVIAAIVAIVVILGSIAAYVYLSAPGTTETVMLNGSGATFPYPLLNEIITQYVHNIKPNVQVNYQAIGSGGGISDLKNKNVDFAGSDAPLTATESADIPNALHIPETIGAVTVTYNLPGVSSGLKLTGQVLADIFQGTITKWNDPAIQNLNPDVTLPSQSIATVHRSDGSGTTFIFTSYLSKVSTSWSTAVGQGKSVAWPVGIGSNGNAGVASTVAGNQYSIGYVELAYALENDMTMAAIANPSGHYILPTLESTTAAAQAGAATLPAGDASWTGVDLLNMDNAEAYPIVSFTYLLVYKELNVLPNMTQEKATALVQFLWYIVHDGQDLGPDLEYAPLPSNVVQLNEATIQSITFNGQTLSAT